MRDRRADRPFDRISAYKIRESLDRLSHERAVVASIAAYRKDRWGYYPNQLVGCTNEDKSLRLKQVPGNIARRLGEDLIPAIEALGCEGIPDLDVLSFAVSIKPRVKRLIDDCETVRTTGRLYNKRQTKRLGSCAVLCDEALNIADEAVLFCRSHGVL
jgi:hypothetical protein